MTSTASFSEDRKFRYTLLREWDSVLPKACFIGLNPSTADETQDDPTIRRCIGFAKAWGKGGLLMLNMYAFRATLPADMKKAHKKGVDIIGGKRNHLEALQQYVHDHNCDIVIAAWGAHGLVRGMVLSSSWPELMCLGRNTDGSPKHPLYLKADSQPEKYRVGFKPR